MYNQKMEQQKENIWNVPNFITSLRVVFALITIYFIFSDLSIIYAVISFLLGMLTDFFDGHLARKMNQKTEFGRQFDVIADRILLVGAILALALKLSFSGLLNNNHLYQMIFMMSREIISFPFLIFSMIFKIRIPHVRMIGKITTATQSVAIPLVFLSVFYNIFSFSWYFAIISGILGITAAFYYIYDVIRLYITKDKNIIN